MTVASEDEATKIGTELVQLRLAACVNILGPSRSIYWWDESVNTNIETVMILKTSDKKLELLISAAIDLHSYDCPAIIALEIKKGNPDFLNWITKETS